MKKCFKTNLEYRYLLVLFALISTILSCKKRETTDGDTYTGLRTVGLFLNNTSKVYNGYTLFAPKQYTSTYLINNDGKIMHQWSASKYPPGQSVYLLVNGNLLRSFMTQRQ